MSSPTAEVKKIVINLLKSKPGVNFPIAEIKEEIVQNATQKITEGVIAGALYTLTKDKNSGILSPERTIYAYNPQTEEKELDLTNKLFFGVNESIEILKNVSKSIDSLEIEAKDLPNLKKFKSLIESLENFNDELLQEYGEEING